jgi:AI-2 transport protein TqsA
LGSIVATILPLPIAIDQYESGWLILAAILLPGLANFFVAYFIEPKVMGHELQVHPVVIILALVILGLLWGVAGAFLAMPMAAILRITLMESDTLAPVADLMGGKLPGADPGGEAGSAKDAAGREGE